MDIDEEMRRQTVVSLIAVGLFLAALIGIGVVFGSAGGLSSSGALALVGALAGFVLLMAVIGIVLIRLKDN
jgi:membrane protein YdbS with pleckstrin-like domain